MHNYSLRKQRLIPIACCTLHNFIRRENASDRLFGDFDVQDLVTNDEGDTSRPLTNIDLSPASVAEMNATRDAPRSRSATTTTVRLRSVTTMLVRSRTVSNDLPGYDSDFKRQKIEGQLVLKEELYGKSTKAAAKVEKWLLPSEGDYLEAEGVEKTWRIKQEAIVVK
ncbi:hypothetical protein WN943_023189 [Citrus x changshan-huyou]